MAAAATPSLALPPPPPPLPKPPSPKSSSGNRLASDGSVSASGVISAAAARIAARVAARASLRCANMRRLAIRPAAAGVATGWEYEPQCASMPGSMQTQPFRSPQALNTSLKPGGWSADASAPHPTIKVRSSRVNSADTRSVVCDVQMPA